MAQIILRRTEKKKSRKLSKQFEVRPLVVCGPSGVGKGTLLEMLLKDFPHTFSKCVSHTTRSPRQGEEHGVHYYFVNKDYFEKSIQEGHFIEHANVHGNYYGTSVQAARDVMSAGKICILEIDVQGAESVRKANLDALFLFVHPPSFETLEERLTKRGTEDAAKIRRRLSTAKRELEFAKKSSWDKELINHDLHETYQTLCEFLFISYPHLKQSPTQKSVHPTSKSSL